MYFKQVLGERGGSLIHFPFKLMQISKLLLWVYVSLYEYTYTHVDICKVYISSLYVAYVLIQIL